MKLYDKDCKNAKPRNKAYKLFDGKGLYLEVKPTGGKLWRLKYHYLGKEKSLSLGVYPIVTLAEAREKCIEAKKLLDRGIDPSAAKQERQREIIRAAANSFEAVALEWHEKQKERWSKEYAVQVLHRLQTDVFPSMPKKPIKDLDVPELLDVLRKIEQRGALELLKRARQFCGEIFRYAIQTGRCKEDITLHLKGALKTRKTKHYSAIEIKEIPELLKALKDDERLYDRTRRAVRLSLLTFQRPGEIRQAKKAEIDWEAKQWVIPAERMKMRRAHIVPLSRQALEILKEQFDEIKRFNTEWVFPSQVSLRDPMSENTVRTALHRLGFKDRMTSHGFRALARTTIREKLDYAPDIIEAQLAHKPSGPLGEAYDRATFIRQRTEMMQAWADYLDGVAETGKVDVPASTLDTAKDRQETGVRSVPLPLEPSFGSGAGLYRIVYLNCPIENK